MKQYILILGSDTHAQAIAARLDEAGELPITLDTRSKEWHVGGDLFHLSLWHAIHNLWLDESNLKSVYWRSHDGVTGPSELARTNRLSLLESWLVHLQEKDVPMYNPYNAWNLHRHKPFQNLYLQKIVEGICIPDLTYNGRLDDFEEDEPIIWKPAQGGDYATSGEPHAPGVEYAWQRRIYGTTLRVYVFQDQVITYDIKANAVDYRQDPNCQSEPCLIAPQIAKRLQAMQKALAMSYGWLWSGCDLIRDENGQYWLLDVNPSPMFLGFEDNYEVSRALARHLSG